MKSKKKTAKSKSKVKSKKKTKTKASKNNKPDCNVSGSAYTSMAESPHYYYTISSEPAFDKLSKQIAIDMYAPAPQLQGLSEQLKDYKPSLWERVKAWVKSAYRS